MPQIMETTAALNEQSATRTDHTTNNTTTTDCSRQQNECIGHTQLQRQHTTVTAAAPARSTKHVNVHTQNMPLKIKTCRSAKHVMHIKLEWNTAVLTSCKLLTKILRAKSKVNGGIILI